MSQGSTYTASMTIDKLKKVDRDFTFRLWVENEFNVTEYAINLELTKSKPTN